MLEVGRSLRNSCSTYFSLFLCGIDTSLFPRKTLSCLRGVPLLFLSCEGAQRLQSVKDRRPDAVGGKGEVSSRRDEADGFAFPQRRVS